MALFEVEVRLSAGGSGWIVQPARNEAEARRLVGIMFKVIWDVGHPLDPWRWSRRQEAGCKGIELGERGSELGDEDSERRAEDACVYCKQSLHSLVFPHTIGQSIRSKGPYSALKDR